MDENTGRWPSWELAEVKWLFEWRVWSKQFSGRKESWMFEIQFGRWKGRHGSDGKESACTVGDPGSIPGSGRSPEEGNGNILQLFLPWEFHGQSILVGYSPRGCKESNMTEWYTTNKQDRGRIPLSIPGLQASLFKISLWTAIFFQRHREITHQR